MSERADVWKKVLQSAVRQNWFGSGKGQSGFNAPSTNAGTIGKSLAWSFGSDFATKVATFATTLIAVRSLDPIRFGQFTGLLAAALLAASCWDAGLTTLLTREYAARHLSIRQAVARSWILRLKLAAIWIAIFACGVVIVTRGYPIGLGTVACFAGGSLLFATSAIPLALLRGALRFKHAGYAAALGRWLAAVISLGSIGVAGLDRRLQVLALGFVFGEGLTLVLAAIEVNRVARRTASFSNVGAQVLTLRSALPFAANNILSIAYNRFDVVILAALSSVTQLSFYAPASRIQDALYLLPSSLGMVALPILSGLSSHAGEPLEARRIVRMLIIGGLALALPVSICLTIFAPTIIAGILGPAYIGAVPATRIIVWFLPLAVIQAPLLALLAATGQAIQTTKVFVATFLAAGVMHLSLDWWWGATGGAVATLSRDIVAVMVLFLIVHKTGLFDARLSPAARGQNVMSAEAIQ